MLSFAANFNCEPLERPLRFWLRHLGWTDEARFAPYNQVFQQLADPSGLFLSSANKASVILIRHEDWARFAGEGPGDTIHARTRELIDAIDAAARQTSAPIVLVLCPPSDPASAALSRTRDAELEAAFAGRAGVIVLRGDAIAARYRCETIADPHTDALGHVPFTAEYFAALATAIVRALWGLRSPPRKVIVLDCDQTLWGGVLGEDGVHGVTLDPARRALQELVVAQQQRGALICLCSKNNEADVWELFRQRSDMVLTRDHLVGWRINWQLKSANIAELAAELGLGLDSFVFIDDDGLQCAEVRAHCPQVVTVQVPERVEDLPAILDHLWVFDRPHVTAEDRERTAMYKRERERDQARQSSSSLGEFLASLQLRTEIEPASAADFPRLSQLTHRTNQFNLTTIRRSEAELRELAADPANVCLRVRVADRFGDYGLVGLALARRLEDRLDVETLLMSCRVLGRGVEHRIIAELGAVAKASGLGSVVIHFRPSAKNTPAREFVEAALGPHGADGPAGERVFTLPADVAAGLELHPDSAPVAAPREDTDGARPAGGVPAAAASELICEIAELRTGRRLLERMSASTAFAPDDKFTSATEGAVARIFVEQLAVDDLARESDFYSLGGDSLKALQVLARIRDELGVELPLDALFESTLSVESLSRWIDQHRRTK